MSHPRSSLRALAAGLALATLVPLSLAPADAQACVHDMYVNDPLALVSTWPAQDQADFPSDGVVQITHSRNLNGRRVPGELGVEVIDLQTEAEVRMRYRASPLRPETEAWWAPAQPWRAGGQYRMKVVNYETQTVIADLTWQVGTEPAPTSTLAADPGSWCLDQVRVEGPCVGGRDSCDGCLEFGPPTWVAQARLTLAVPDPEQLARSGRSVVLAHPGRPVEDVMLSTETHHLWLAEGDLSTCFSVGVARFDHSTEVRAEVCPPEVLLACPDAPSPQPGDGGLDGGSLGDGGPDSGGLDAGAPGTDGDAATHSTQPVVEKSSCQASPGVDGVPLAAGLLAILAGLPRRRRAD